MSIASFNEAAARCGRVRGPLAAEPRQRDGTPDSGHNGGLCAPLVAALPSVATPATRVAPRRETH